MPCFLQSPFLLQIIYRMYTFSWHTIQHNVAVLIVFADYKTLLFIQKVPWLLHKVLFCITCNTGCCMLCTVSFVPTVDLTLLIFCPYFLQQQHHVTECVPKQANIMLVLKKEKKGFLPFFACMSCLG